MFSHTWTSGCASSYTPGPGGGQESPCSEFSRFRGGYTQQHGDIVGWGQPSSTIRHQDGSGHVGGDPAGQEKSAVGHLGLVACPLQRDGLERTSSLSSGTAWGNKHSDVLSLTLHYTQIPTAPSDELKCHQTCFQCLNKLITFTQLLLIN